MCLCSALHLTLILIFFSVFNIAEKTGPKTMTHDMLSQTFNVGDSASRMDNATLQSNRRLLPVVFSLRPGPDDRARFLRYLATS